MHELDSIPPRLSDFAASPHHPLVVTGNARAPGQVIGGSAHPGVRVDINGPAVPIESELFVGRMCVHFRGLRSSDEGLFAGKKRSVWYSFQGRFKRPVAVDDLYTGQEFFVDKSEAPPVPLPVAKFILRTAATISSSRPKVEVTSTYVCAMSVLASSCQILNVSRPGEEPNLLHADEDARLLSPGLADAEGEPLQASMRRKLMDKPSFTAGLTLGTDYVYTFVSWLHHVNWPKLEVDLAGFVSFNLAKWLPPNRPLVMMSMDIKTGEKMHDLCVWHPKMLVKLHHQQEQAMMTRSNEMPKLYIGSVL